jgi:putative chitinase
MAVWPNRFPDRASALPFLRDPERLAEHVYGGRMGNDRKGDGYRYRGRGWLQLTGRANYRRFGALVGLGLESDPDRAAEPIAAWRIASAFLATRRRVGRSALEWADADNAEMVTRIVNGGITGLDDRRLRTAAALAALRAGPVTLRRGDEGPEVLLLQQALARRGFPPGALDGSFGPRTEAALTAFQRHAGLPADGQAGTAVRGALQSSAA